MQDRKYRSFQISWLYAELWILRAASRQDDIELFLWHKILKLKQLQSKLQKVCKRYKKLKVIKFCGIDTRNTKDPKIIKCYNIHNCFTKNYWICLKPKYSERTFLFHQVLEKLKKNYWNGIKSLKFFLKLVGSVDMLKDDKFLNLINCDGKHTIVFRCI